MNSFAIQARAVSTTSPVDKATSVGGAAPAPPASALPTPEFSGDVATALAQLMLKSEFVRKNLAHEERKVAEAGMKSAQEAQIKELTTEADKKLDAATEAAVGTIGNGVLCASTAAMDIATTNGPNEPRKDVSLNGAKMDRRAVSLASDRDFGKGAGGVFEGSMKLDAAAKDHEASKANIRAKADENLASAWKNSIDDAKDARQDAQERIGRVHDWLKSLEETTAQTTMSAIKA